MLSKLVSVTPILKESSDNSVKWKCRTHVGSYIPLIIVNSSYRHNDLLNSACLHQFQEHPLHGKSGVNMSIPVHQVATPMLSLLPLLLILTLSLFHCRHKTYLHIHSPRSFNSSLRTTFADYQPTAGPFLPSYPFFVLNLFSYFFRFWCRALN